MIEPRIYRAAFIPAVIVAIVALFSLENRPEPDPQGLPADVLFDGHLAKRQLDALIAAHPRRQPGSIGDKATGDEVGRAFARAGFKPTIKDIFHSDDETLVNVIGRRAGQSRDQIVIMAARDARTVPDATGSGASTAALLELARVFQGRPTKNTLVLASVDGSTLGELGAERTLERLPDRGRVKAVIVLSNLGARGRAGRSPLVGWANSAVRESIGLERTAVASLREEVGAPPPDAGAIGQVMRLAFPIGLGAQGVLLENGFPAIRFSSTGELPPRDVHTGLKDVDVDRLGSLGRAALRTVSAVDAGKPLHHGPGAYVIAARKVIPGWALALLSAALLLPPLVASIDAFARVRRRREPTGAAWRWLGAGILPFGVALVLGELLVLVGAAPDAHATPPPPEQFPLDARAVVILGALTAAVVLVWLVGRGRAGGGRRSEDRLARSSGAAAVCALALCVVCTAIWVLNPFAALLLVPAAHLWTLALLAGAPVRRLTGALVLVAGLLLPLLLVIYYTSNLDLGPIQALWYLFLLVTGHQIGLATALLGCVLFGVVGSVAVVLLSQRAVKSEKAGDEPPAIRGPGGYVGPGSLGGTGSAIKR